VYLWRHRAYFATDTEPTDDATLAAMKPASIFVGAVGLGMAVLAISFVRYQLGRLRRRSRSAPQVVTRQS
jgi:hypothetical protein